MKLPSTSAKRIVGNTIIIYLQRFSAAGLALITTPLVLNALGVDDFGLYSLTVGFVGMLSFLMWSLSSSTQRYIAFTLGEKNFHKLKSVFSTAVVIHLLYGVLLVLAISVFGFFFQRVLLNIPPGRESAASTVLILVALMTFCSIITIHFTGALRANENFRIIALIGIMESVLKLTVAVSLLFFGFDKLIFYSALLAITSFIVFAVHAVLVHKLYRDLKFSFGSISLSLMKEMLSFLGWSLLGALALVSRNQGVAVMLNIFFGVVRNAAYGIAMQVNAAIAILSQGVIASMSPQIIRAAGARETGRMIHLMRTMSKFATFSISVVAIPIFIEAPAILKLWLRDVPSETVTYVRLIIVFGQIMLLSSGIQTVFDALGKVKLYNMWVSLILMLNLPVSYLIFTIGYPSYSIIVIGMLLEIVTLFVRLQLLKKYVSFSIVNFWLDTSLRVVLPLVFVAVVVWCLKGLVVGLYVELAITFLATLVIYPSTIYFLSLDQSQKQFVQSIVPAIIKRLKS